MHINTTFKLIELVGKYTTCHKIVIINSYTPGAMIMLNNVES